MVYVCCKILTEIRPHIKNKPCNQEMQTTSVNYYLYVLN